MAYCQNTSTNQSYCICQSPYRTEIDKVSTELRAHHFLNISSNLGVFSSSNSSKIHHTCNLFGESDTSCAMNTSIHDSRDQRTKIFVLNCSFIFVEATFSVPIDSRNILQIAFTSLITDWAIKWMVCEKKFHHTTSCIPSNFA